MAKDLTGLHRRRQPLSLPVALLVGVLWASSPNLFSVAWLVAAADELNIKLSRSKKTIFFFRSENPIKSMGVFLA